jgi:hypothetical protein
MGCRLKLSDVWEARRKALVHLLQLGAVAGSRFSSNSYSSLFRSGKVRKRDRVDESRVIENIEAEGPPKFSGGPLCLD